MANLAATIANHGWYITPHVIKQVGREGAPLPQFTERHYTSVDSLWYGYVARSMVDVVRAGTASLARIPDIKVAGKTGTAQNPHGEDHSVFMCFAPYDKPQIAVAVYVENAGFGGTWAAPIASLLAEYYIRGGELHRQRKWVEAYVLRGNLLGNDDDKKDAEATQ